MYLSLLFHSLSLAAVSPLNSNLRFDHLTIDDGLSQSDVTSIIQDQTGYLWIGTNNGLNRYDGYRFTKWKWDPKATESTISGNTVMSLCAGKDGKVWIATTTSLDAYDPDMAGFINYKEKLKEVIPGTSTFRINAVFCDDSGDIWLCFRNKLLKFDSSLQKFDLWTIQDKDITPYYIQDIKADSHHNLYLGSNWGFSFLIPSPRLSVIYTTKTAGTLSSQPNQLYINRTYREYTRRNRQRALAIVSTGRNYKRNSFGKPAE